jgi:response regulator of citrate/malate metabolism
VITADEDKMVDQYVKKKLEEIAIKNGANEYIHKPIKYKTLKKVLDKFIKVRSSFV